MFSNEKQELQHYLESFLSTRRAERMQNVLAQRTRYITCVLEDLYDPRNGSAIMRHCDALGIHEVHVIENRNRFRSDRQVDLGTAQWLDIHLHPSQGEARLDEDSSSLHSANTSAVLSVLKSRGYRIVATSPHFEGLPPEDLDLETGPVAVVFGSEKHGISDAVQEQTDAFLRIPMTGFVESFNISAAAAIVFHVLTGRIRRESLQWPMEKSDAAQIYLQWLKTATPHAKSLIQHFHLRSSDSDD